MLKDIKLLLGIDDDSRDDLLNLLISNAQTQLLGRLGDLETVPVELAYIVPELVIIRYNRIGAEGLSSQSVEGHSANYQVDDLAPFESAIKAYLNKHREPRTGVVRFL